MEGQPQNPSVDTYYAPAPRAEREELLAARERFLADKIAVTLLESLPYIAVVLNSQRQIIAANTNFLNTAGVNCIEDILGRRPGEVIGCVHAEEGPGGCGTSEACAMCGAVNAVLEAYKTHQPVSMEGHILTKIKQGGGALDVKVSATLVPVGEYDLVVVAMNDISSEKRRRVLERVFFHDVMNTATGIHGLADLLVKDEDDTEAEDEYKHGIFQLAARIIDEIDAHKQLLAAESGELRVRPADIHIPDLLRELIETYRHQGIAGERMLTTGDVAQITIRSDKTLLRRVLANLISNALEATAEGGTVTLSAVQQDDKVVFSVNNPGVMSDEVRLQIFQRSFSTKREEGHGIGTHSVRLFSEKYLGGNVDFTSQAPEGTTFRVTLPKELPD